MVDHTDLLLAGMAAPCQVQGYPAVSSAMDVMVPSEGTNAREWRVLPADHSLPQWTARSEVQENNPGKVGCALFTCVECS